MLTLSRTERIALECQAQADHGSAPSARHARLVLLLAEGHTWSEIRARLGCSDSFIARWSRRFATERLAGLYTRHAGRERYKMTDKLEQRVLRQTLRHTPADGSRYWSSRKLAAELGGAISHMTVARIWAKHGIRPHRLDAMPTPDHPAFNASAADIVGLYLNRPQHAAIFSVAVDPQQPGAADPLPPRGRPGMIALSRSLVSCGGPASAVRARRSGAAELAAFIASVMARHADGHETHVVADNTPASQPQRLKRLLANHPEVHLHLTGSYPSWIAQMDRILVKIELALLAFGPAHGALGLRTRIVRAIRHCNQRPTPMKWNHLAEPPDAATLPDAADPPPPDSE